MSHRRSLVSFGLVSIFATQAFGSVIVVPSGSPPTAIATAVASAVDGDVILVQAGAYSGFVINGKGVSVVADARASVTIAGSVGVINLPANRDALISGLTVTGSEQGANFPSPTSTSGAALYAFDDAGSVRVAGCTLQGGVGDTDSMGTSSQGGIGAKVRNSPDVVVVGSTLRGGVGGGCHTCWIASGGGGGRGVSSSNAYMALYDCAVHGGLGGEAGEYSGYGGHGAEVSDGRAMFASNSLFAGGDGGRSSGCEDTFFCCHEGIAGDGGNGLRVTSNAWAQLLGDAFTPGAGGYSTCGWHGQPGGDMSQQDAGGVFTFNVSARTLDMPRVAREGDNVTISFAGQAGDEVSALFARGTAFQLIPSERGVLVAQHVGATPARWMRLGTIAAASTPLTHTFTVRELGPGVEEQTWHVQFVVRGSVAGRVLGGYAPIVYLDSSL